jgi:hypothetical protein
MSSTCTRSGMTQVTGITTNQGCNELGVIAAPRTRFVSAEMRTRKRRAEVARCVMTRLVRPVAEAGMGHD